MIDANESRATTITGDRSRIEQDVLDLSDRWSVSVYVHDLGKR
jgi:hypothetical protein